MFLQSFQIDRKSLVADIVASDYRTAEVFRKYGIGYCCGGKWPMELACEMNGVDLEVLQLELLKVTRTNQVSNNLDFSDCTIDFVIDYIINIHHAFLKKSLGGTKEMVNDFAKEHAKKFTYLSELEAQLEILTHELFSSIQQEEEVIFPYIKHLVHAYKHKEPYAALMVKTLRRPIEDSMFNHHGNVSEIISSFRKLTNNYTPPEKVCISHKVVLSKLKELDNDLMQHLFLEQSVLFPKTIVMEKEVLS